MRPLGKVTICWSVAGKPMATLTIQISSIQLSTIHTTLTKYLNFMRPTLLNSSSYTGIVGNAMPFPHFQFTAQGVHPLHNVKATLTRNKEPNLNVQYPHHSSPLSPLLTSITTHFRIFAQLAYICLFIK